MILQKIIAPLEKDWNASIDYKSISLTIWNGSLTIKGLQIKPRENTCIWTCNVAKFQLLPIKSLLNKTINLHVSLLDNTIETKTTENNLAIAGMLNKIFSSNARRFQPEQFTLDNITLSILPPGKPIKCLLNGRFIFTTSPAHTMAGKIVVHNGCVYLDNRLLINHISGTSLWYNNALTISHTCTLPMLGSKPLYLKGTWEKEHANFEIMLKKLLSTKIDWHTTQNNGLFTLIFPHNHRKITGKIIYKPSKLFLQTSDSRASLSVNKTDNNAYTFYGKMHYSLLRSLLPQRIKKMLIGASGTLFYKGSWGKNNVKGTLSFINGKIRFPHSYNFVQNGTIKYLLEFNKKCLFLSSGHIVCHKGSFNLPHATICYNDLFTTSNMTIPITFNKILVNYENDIAALTSGDLYIEKGMDTRLSCTGSITIEKAVIRENNLLQTESTNKNNHDYNLNINVTNKNPIIINTGFLQSELTGDITIQTNASSHKPSISGVLFLQNGCFNFLRNKLYLSSGTINFLESHTNPSLDILARNRIKKYIVTMHISGTKENTLVSLESNPPLHEAQIISLLFGGSEHSSLQADISALIMQHMSALLKKPRAIKKNTASLFETITRPLKYVHITPHFTDESGRGGIKGTMSIDINKQFHAFIQKNFTMQDDFSIQLEYFLSDDFNIKALKDSRGDIGAELELRFKPTFM